MQIIHPYFVIETPIDGENILAEIERFGRVCYKSEDRITPGSARRFVANILASGHESVIEHFVITVRFICDRGVSHELVRHRIGSFSQESTRYCNYGKRGLQVIAPLFFEEGTERYEIWLRAMEAAEQTYNALLAAGATPQEARSVLPNSLKTEIVVTFNLREWRHFFHLRCTNRAHPQMRELTIPLLHEFQRQISVIFDDIVVEE
jgi:thymidylate synthase (FAD)